MIDRFGLGRSVGQQANELVAAKPRQQGVWRKQAGNSLGGSLQHGIPRRVPVEIVDLLEVVEIDDDGRQRAFGNIAAGHRRAGSNSKAAAVEAGGQMIDFRQPAHFGFCRAMLRQLDGQLLVSLPAEDDQCDVQNKRVGQREIGRGGAALPRPHQVRHECTCRDGKQEDRGQRDSERKPVACRTGRGTGWRSSLVRSVIFRMLGQFRSPP